MAELTVHCMIRNEERFIRPAILAMLPLAQRVLVYDTGSTDGTLEALASIRSDKLELVQKTFTKPLELTGFRNEMIERTRTEWFMLVDGDEVYPAHAVTRLAEFMPTVPPTVHRIVVHRKHFVGSMNFVSRPDTIGRIFRTSLVRWRTGYPLRHRLRADTPYLRDGSTVPLSQWSVTVPQQVFFFHCQYLLRSSQDAEVGMLRRWRWRQPPFPVVPYFGPWPETLQQEPVIRQLRPWVLWEWLGLNTQLLGTWGMAAAKKVVGA